ncbi:cGMP-dependent protein kinase isozyme 1 [Fasciola gigantica]|uniref:cGMP-dependent protein kinase isozyme 1 n=1 Tax=Fasciola gigantica TaxID=46835 RepID=A0A504Z2S5_FASGI|nr:cGMP-dependent protein kinase isozyme 1 [Fasciola gigantica]
MPHYPTHLFSPIPTSGSVALTPTCVPETETRLGEHACTVLTHKPSPTLQPRTTCASTEKKSFGYTNRRSSRKFSTCSPYLLRSVRQAIKTGSAAQFSQMDSTNSLVKSVNPMIEPGHGLSLLTDPISAGYNLNEPQPMMSMHSGPSMTKPIVLHGGNHSSSSNSPNMPHSARPIMSGIPTSVHQQSAHPLLTAAAQSITNQPNARIPHIMNSHHSPSSSPDRTAQTVVIDGRTYELHDLISVITRLKQDVLACTDRIRWLESELHQSRLLVSARDRDIHKLRSVLDQKVPNTQSPTQTTQPQHMDTVLELDEALTGPNTGAYDSLIPCGSSVLGITSKNVPEGMRMKKQGQNLIREAIENNDFLRHLDKVQIEEIVCCMYKRNILQGSYIIREGQSGDALYVVAEGVLEVSKQGQLLGRMDRSGSEELSPEKMHKLADVLESIYYGPDEYIIREGEIGETFFIIQSGTLGDFVLDFRFVVFIFVYVRSFETICFFYAPPYNRSEKRSANVISMEGGVHLLSLDRSNFIHLIGDLSEIRSKDYGETRRSAASEPSTPSCDSNAHVAQRLEDHLSLRGRSAMLPMPTIQDEPSLSAQIKMDDLEPIAVLGIGGFGCVELVVWTKDRSKSFALKRMKKQHIVQTRQQEHICSERQIMLELRCPFICR